MNASLGGAKTVGANRLSTKINQKRGRNLNIKLAKFRAFFRLIFAFFLTINYELFNFRKISKAISHFAVHNSNDYVVDSL